MENQPIAIATKATASSTAASLPEPLRQLLQLRIQADSALQHPALQQEVCHGHHGPQAETVRQALAAIVDRADSWKHGKLITEEQARGEYVVAWALGRIGEYDGTDAKALPQKMQASLDRFQRAASLLNVPAPPTLDNVPSVARPREGAAPLPLPPVPAWATEMLAEWARAQTTLAFSTILAEGKEGVAPKLADLLDLACRRNVQALFTPVDPLSANEEEGSPYAAGTVMGNAKLIRDMMTLLPFSTSPSDWTKRLQWSTHVADVRFAELSMAANRLADEASSAASVLQNKSVDNETRQEVRSILERIAQDMLPVERAQGVCLMVLGRAMLEAVSAIYLQRDEALLAARRRRDSSRDPLEDEDEDENDSHVSVPENELVRETRQVFIRAAALLENAYATYLRSPSRSRSRRKELRLLRRLETTYCNLEELDNDAPETLQLRSERIERALWINDRLLALGDTNEDEEDISDEDSDDDSEEDLLARRLAQSIHL
ncbi:hypothetical protein OIV83_005615 [Microbotryomycetes sp. JL201]|nr:hypothetical protein OIV83_005615 [Microbotryomycetes sp. JL201]